MRLRVLGPAPDCISSTRLPRSLVSGAGSRLSGLYRTPDVYGRSRESRPPDMSQALPTRIWPPGVRGYGPKLVRFPMHAAALARLAGGRADEPVNRWPVDVVEASYYLLPRCCAGIHSGTIGAPRPRREVDRIADREADEACPVELATDNACEVAIAGRITYSSAPVSASLPISRNSMRIARSICAWVSALPSSAARNAARKAALRM